MMSWRACGPAIGLAVLLLLMAPAIAPCADADRPLQALAVARVGADQGVFVVAGDGAVLAAVVPDRPVHPASVTKIATTLALLRELGPQHRFATRFRAGGSLRDGAIDGNLVVMAGRDPFFVYEGAFLVLLELHRLGVRRVAGRVDVDGPLLFNWSPDDAGRRLQQALAGQTGHAGRAGAAGENGAAAWAAVQAAREDARTLRLQDIGLGFGGRNGPSGREGPVLVVHQSPPLLRIVKELNGYSNNIFHLLADQIGGTAAVERIARESVGPDLRGEVVITNAAGAGTTNRLSPRAAVGIIRALDDEVRRHGLTLADVLPVAGVDRGTLEDRLNAPAYRGAVVAKTGTYGSLGACALAGTARTKRWGTVTFAVLNRGLSVPEARRRQDTFLEALLDLAGAVPLPSYAPPAGAAFTTARIERPEDRPSGAGE
jgi:D-alanyl-D-alanine carboxypeptidase/D-alanyl-D-alanine-endopeptidase (penicillin-binding protein 4)